MRQISFAVSSALAISGATVAVSGIINESFKISAVGLVLVFTAGVFATLYLGSRTRLP